MAKLRIPYIPGIPSLPIFVADDRKIFHRHGLTPELTNAGADTGSAVEEVAKGTADLTFPAFFFVVEAAIGGDSNLLVLQHEVDSNVAPTFYGLAVKKRSRIKTVDALAGKKVGVFEAKVPDAKQDLFAAYAHSLADDVETIPLQPEESIAALKKGDIDALLTAQPIATFAQIQGAGKLISETPLAGTFPTVIPTSAAIATASKAEKDPSYTRAVASALDEAVDLIRGGDVSAGELYIKYGVMPEGSEELGDYLVLQYWKSSEIGEPGVQISQVYSDYLTEYGVITGSADVRSLYRDTGDICPTWPAVPEWAWHLRAPGWLDHGDCC